MPEPTKKNVRVKPAKPRPDFPLFSHCNGSWAKKVRGRLRYFGPWTDPAAALERWLDQKDDLLAGREPRVKSDGLTVRDLLNAFLTSKQHLVDTGKLTKRSFLDYHRTCTRISEVFGVARAVDSLTPADFEKLRAGIAKTCGPVAIGNEVQRIRVAFNYAYNADLTEKPVKFGPTFKRPSKRILRKAQQAAPKRLFERDEVLAMIDAAAVHLRAMLYLGINAAYGPSDIGHLPRKALDLDKGWATFPRPKTSAERRCPLWAETVQALRASLAVRPEPKDPSHAGRVFLTRYGAPWAQDRSAGPISAECGKLLTQLGIRRRGVNFYSLRHTHRTIGDEVNDQPASDLIMGHAADDMASRYRQRISDARLKAVTNHVHGWLFGPDSGAENPAENANKPANASNTEE